MRRRSESLDNPKEKDDRKISISGTFLLEE